MGTLGWPCPCFGFHFNARLGLNCSFTQSTTVFVHAATDLLAAHLPHIPTPLPNVVQSCFQARLRGEEPEIDPKFAVFVSGFPSYASDHAALFATSSEGESDEPAMQVDIPSLHIMGTTDQVIPVDLSRRLASFFAQPVVVTHEGGHFVPWPKSGTQQREAILSFFQDRQHDLQEM